MTLNVARELAELKRLTVNGYVDFHPSLVAENHVSRKRIKRPRGKPPRPVVYDGTVIEYSNSQPSNKIDALVEPSVKRCIVSDDSLAALAEIIGLLGNDPNWTANEIEELRRRAIDAIVADARVFDRHPVSNQPR